MSRKMLLPKIALIAALAAACGGSSTYGEDVSDGGTGSDTSNSYTPSEPAVAVGGGGDASVCADFYKTVADYTMSDEASATAFGDLATQATDPALKDALTTVSMKFANHSASVSSEAVTAACDRLK